MWHETKKGYNQTDCLYQTSRWDIPTLGKIAYVKYKCSMTCHLYCKIKNGPQEKRRDFSPPRKRNRCSTTTCSNTTTWFSFQVDLKRKLTLQIFEINSQKDSESDRQTLLRCFQKSYSRKPLFGNSYNVRKTVNLHFKSDKNDDSSKFATHLSC